ncbi:MAG TPA: perosamine synthetase [Acidimicrobiaceae bacterium]|nr:perosamine synthetase [Acidimicrobiaceae bacterium]|tara:strand:+ start:1456 stop:2628 length:1173 start_codon:yes stop_codon:yes gene_type:complete
MPISDQPAVLGGTPTRPEGPPPWPPADADVARVIREAADDGSWGRYHGSHSTTLSERLAQRHGFDHAVLCSSGTVAVELALRGLKVGDGDEVILAAYDFRGNMQDVLCVGATPVLVDIRPDDWQIRVDQVERALSDRTAAILVSHLHGGQVDMPRLRELADRHGLPVIEDACQVPGARVAGRMAGAWGDVAVWSFGGSKLLSAGRGGALLTSDDAILQRVRTYSERGNQAYPLSELQAALLLPQLDKLEERNGIREEAAQYLIGRLAHIRALVPLTHSCDADSQPGLYKLGFQFQPEEAGGLSRDAFARAVRAEGVAIDPGFRSLHKSHSKRRFRAAGELPQADGADNHILVMHHPVLLEPTDALDQVAQAVQRVLEHAEPIGRELGFSC